MRLHGGSHRFLQRFARIQFGQREGARYHDEHLGGGTILHKGLLDSLAHLLDGTAGANIATVRPEPQRIKRPLEHEGATMDQAITRALAAGLGEEASGDLLGRAGIRKHGSGGPCALARSRASLQLPADRLRHLGDRGPRRHTGLLPCRCAGE